MNTINQKAATTNDDSIMLHYGFSVVKSGVEVQNRGDKCRAEKEKLLP